MNDHGVGSIDRKMISGALFLCPLRHSQPLIPYSVAKHQACRNNSDNNQANFLEKAKNPLTFASSIRTNSI
jgi:hypothetical protein